MPEVIAQGIRCSYETTGDGFPLVLTPGSRAWRAVWTAYLPLLGELCRTIAYVCHEECGPQEELTTGARAADTLDAFLDALGLERVYLASQSGGWPVALRFALLHPKRLESLVLVAAHEVALDAGREVMALAARLPEITVPTLVLLAEPTHATWPCAAMLAERLPGCTQIVLPAPAPSARVPALQLGHAMMHFLLHCERRRNLVRGASFLL